MSAALALLRNEVELHGVELRRHWWEPLVSVAVVSALFLALYHGLRVFAVGSVGRGGASLDALLLGYVAWGIAGAAYNSIARYIAEEAQTGTLEQLYLSPHPFGAIMLARAVVHMGSGLFSAALLALIAMVGTGRVVHLPIAHALALLLLGSLSLLGVGLAIGGAVLVHKRMSGFAALMNLFLLGVVCVPAYPANLASLLPFAYAASAVRALAAARAQPSLAMYSIIAANAAAYLVVGFAVFTWLERKAKAMNALGRY
jgi:ABC-2 type transport system permease protein